MPASRSGRLEQLVGRPIQSNSYAVATAMRANIGKVTTSVPRYLRMVGSTSTRTASRSAALRAPGHGASRARQLHGPEQTETRVGKAQRQKHHPGRAGPWQALPGSYRARPHGRDKIVLIRLGGIL